MGGDFKMLVHSDLKVKLFLQRPPPIIKTSRSDNRTAFDRLTFIIGNEPSGDLKLFAIAKSEKEGTHRKRERGNAFCPLIFMSHKDVYSCKVV